jgi:hypothetical protein
MKIKSMKRIKSKTKSKRRTRLTPETENGHREIHHGPKTQDPPRCFHLLAPPPSVTIIAGNFLAQR